MCGLPAHVFDEASELSEETFDRMRRAMVASQLRTTAVNDARIVKVMGEVPRERFVPAEKRMLAYSDLALPLADGRALTPPMVIGRLLTEANVDAKDRVLLIGSGSGYAAELLGRLAASVIALEEEPALLAMAREAVTAPNVRLVQGRLCDGWADAAPYDLIVIDGAVEEITQALIDQLADGGRLVTAMLDQGGVTRLAIGRRGGAGFGTISFADASTPVLAAFTRAAAFSF